MTEQLYNHEVSQYSLYHIFIYLKYKKLCLKNTTCFDILRLQALE